MSKEKLKFACLSCEHRLPKWVGQCPVCFEWNSIEEKQYQASRSKFSSIKSQFCTNKDVPRKILDISFDKNSKYKTGINEIDRVLGEGITKGSLNLIGGDPGVGKSTLLLEISRAIGKKYVDERILYISGEESSAQVAERCKRLKLKSENLYILSETCWQNILIGIKEIKPSFIFLDSIQTIFSSEVSSMAGSISQVREITFELMNICKSSGLTSFLIGHVTKEGSIAGPKILEHMVDCVLYLEGDNTSTNRVLRCNKNRFGNTKEIGLLKLDENGLREIENISEFFIQAKDSNSFGKSITCNMEGNRLLMTEVEALVVENKNGSIKRVTQGIDVNRLSMLVAIIEKYCNIPISFNDIYINIVGGLRLSSRESDLAIIGSLLSSYKGQRIKKGLILLGEIGLTGKVRGGNNLEARMKELEMLDYSEVITSKEIAKMYRNSSRIKVIGIESTEELIEHAFG